MYNLHAVEQLLRKKNMALEKEEKDRLWIKNYIKKVRPGLISKHERRITGFAKKMET